MNKGKLREKLIEWFYTERDEGPCCALVLRHVGESGRSGKDGELYRYKVPHNSDAVKLTEDDIPGIVDDIESAAHDDAEGLGGVQKYRLMAYFTESEYPLVRFTFRMYASDVDEDEVGLTEPATKQGLLGQLMRHNEALMRTSVLAANQTLGMLQRMNAAQGDHIERLLKDRRDNFELVEDLKSQRFERELMLEEHKSKEERYGQMFEKASLLLPAVVNRLSGKKVLPEQATPGEQMFNSFMESLTPDQFHKIMGTLQPHQQLVIASYMEKIQKEEEEKKAVRERSSNGAELSTK